MYITIIGKVDVDSGGGSFSVCGVTASHQVSNDDDDL